MPFPFDGCKVLLHAPAAGAEERIHALLDAGALVSVLSAQPDAVLLDLESRGLIDIVDDADPLQYDVVLRDRARQPAQSPANGERGSVTLVGGGPGDQGLLTIAGMQAIREADVLVCDRLAPLGALSAARADAEVVHVGKIPRGEFTPQEAINELLVRHARAGRRVVRLKGGDSFVFGRGGEEWNACVAAGLPVRSIPGISSSIAAAELIGVPVTHRSLTQGFIVVSGHVAPSDPRNTVDWAALARSGLTIVVLMGVAVLNEIVETLVGAGLSGDTPAACIADASMPSQRSVIATLETIDKTAADAEISAPAVTVIGRVVEALDR